MTSVWWTIKLEFHPSHSSHPSSHIRDTFVFVFSSSIAKCLTNHICSVSPAPVIDLYPVCLSVCLSVSFSFYFLFLPVPFSFPCLSVVLLLCSSLFSQCGPIHFSLTRSWHMAWCCNGMDSLWPLGFYLIHWNQNSLHKQLETKGRKQQEKQKEKQERKTERHNERKTWQMKGHRS